jgi:hypothetical protein
MIEWDKIKADETMREAVVACLTSGRDDAIREAERIEKCASRWPELQNEDLREKAKLCRRQAAHYQQAIGLLVAAEMPAASDPVQAKIERAVQLLRERGYKASAGLDCVAVPSRGYPTYLVRGTDREQWTAERIADHIERLEQAAVPMPAKEGT